jgi:two-component system response regulator WspF
MRVAIVNDMVMAVEVLRRIVSSQDGYEVAWVARDGREAVDRAAQDTPDLILMDLMMPVMDGAEATRHIMKASPCAVLVVTATVSGHAPKVFEAMGWGALDAVKTPSFSNLGDLKGAEDLLQKMARIQSLIAAEEAPAAMASQSPGSIVDGSQCLLAIGASTGGPKALSVVLQALPPDFPVPVVIVQHVDPEFSQGLAVWLDEQTPLSVQTAVEGQKPAPGGVYLAATADHLVMTSDHGFHYTAHPKENPYRPSVDAFFNSLLSVEGLRGIAVLLTGMGRDGAAGLLALKQAGWFTIAQDQRSSTIYGMPRAAAELKAAQAILPIGEIGSSVIKQIQQQCSKGA